MTPATATPVADDDGLGPRLPPLRDAQGTLRARRVWPDRAEDPTTLVVECTGEDGRVVAARVVDGVPAVLTADPCLPGLEAWRTPAGNRVVAHRAGKRAVLSVLGADGHSGSPPGVARFVKVARPRATHRAVTRHEAVRRQLGSVGSAPRVPDLVRHDSTAGVLVLSALPGRSVREVLRAAAAGDRTAVAVRAGAALGGAMTGFALAGPGDELVAHGLGDERKVLERWVGLALAFDVVRGPWRERLTTAGAVAAEELALMPEVRAVLTHRDLHDGQVLLASGVGGDQHPPKVGYLDLDTAATADPGLDLANLLAHLDLLAGTRGVRPGMVRALAAFQRGLTGALQRDAQPVLDEAPARVEALRAVSRVRLAAVHAFRPQAPDVVPGLLAPPVLPPWDVPAGRTTPRHEEALMSRSPGPHRGGAQWRA